MFLLIYCSFILVNIVCTNSNLCNINHNWFPAPKSSSLFLKENNSGNLITIEVTLKSACRVIVQTKRFKRQSQKENLLGKYLYCRQRGNSPGKQFSLAPKV